MTGEGTEPAWWQTRWFALFLVLLATVPLLYPPIPPLVDLPGHMGRYAVQLDPSGPLSQWFAFKWRLIGNMGVDLLIVPMSRLFGLELGVKLIILAIPAMTVAGILGIAREVHGRIPPTTLFALPLAYGHPFIFGFINFSLAMALALLAFALWLRMARTGALQRRPYVFMPLACIIWTAHTFGWGMLGLLCFSGETMRQRDLGKGWVQAGLRSALSCLPMALPLIPMVIWRADAKDMTGDWFAWEIKQRYIVSTFRDRWQIFDLLSLIVLFGVLVTGLKSKSLRFSRNLGFSAVVLIAVYILLPRIIFGSAYADMRLTPFLFVIAIVAIRPLPAASGKVLGVVACAGLTFYAVRIGAHTISFAEASSRYDSALKALDHIPPRSRVVAFTRRTCAVEWSTNRMEHLSAMAMVRRQSFSNDQWEVSGANLMDTIKVDAPGFAYDPSQLVVQWPCRIRQAPWKTPDQSLRTLPRPAFDYVWLIDPPRYDVRLTTGMTLVWTNGPDRLYRIDKR
ncbi:MAG: hypothetical protein ABI898_03630 [Sphingomonadales bacterium]